MNMDSLFTGRVKEGLVTIFENDFFFVDMGACVYIFMFV